MAEQRIWSCFRVKPGTEVKSASRLRVAGYDSFIPVVESWRRLPRHRAKALGRSRERFRLKVLPGHLLVVVRDVRDIRALLSLPQISGIINRDNPYIADEQVVEFAKHCSGITPMGIKRGQHLGLISKLFRIDLGPMAGFEGQCIDATEDSVKVQLGEIPVWARMNSVTQLSF